LTAYINREKTSSAERSSGRKPKLSEKDRHMLKRVVPKNHRTAAAKVTAELNIHPEDTVSTKTVLRELHKSNIRSRAAIAILPIIENNAKRRKRWRDDHKTGRVVFGNT
jgi:hypothetical protein